MTKSKVFCNTPWFEVKINADGTYQTCGAQPKHTSNSDMKNYNVFNLSVNDWINSEYQRNVRLHKLNGIPESLCSICYKEDEIGSSSKRIRDNLKSKINPNQFEKTFKQSPHFQIFEESKNSGFTNVKPISYHLSLGNECNLACKMCSPWSSSRIAVAAIKDGTHTGPARLNWTDNETAWQSVLSQICSTPNLEFVHIIGGEPMLTNRFEQLVDQLIAAKISNIYLGFTTNGTIWNESLIKKLKFFRHVDIGISVECTGILNEYIRQGSNTEKTLEIIDQYLLHKSQNHVYVTVRPVPSALSVHELDNLYRWCLDRKIDVMTNILSHPEYLQIKNLPEHIKQRLLDQYNNWTFSMPKAGVSDPRDPNRYAEHIDNEIKSVINCLKLSADPVQTELLYSNLQKWGWLQHSELSKYFN